MAATREQIMEALQARLSIAAFGTNVTRRNQSPETVASPGNPALILVKHEEQYERQSPSLPPRRTMVVDAIVYIDVGTNVNAIPDAVLNPIQDAFDTALLPDDPSSNRCTLGGLVFSVMIKGTIINAPGDKTGKGLAIVPIEIMIP
jgi:hypothetical protein